MAIYNTYIQQISLDGSVYEAGSVVDLLKTFNIISRDFPFKKNPKPKELPKRDWAGSDGVDVYVPAVLPMKEYDIDVYFLYVGTAETIRTDLSNFIDFLYGRRKAAETDTVQSGRLAVYNEYVGMGRKDMIVSSVDNEAFDCSDYDPDAISTIKVVFTVCDPVTDVVPAYGTNNGERYVSGLEF